MAGEMVTWADYQQDGAVYELGREEVFGGGGLATAAGIDDLNKALTAGADINNPGASPGEGFPLRVESLDATLYSVTYQSDQIKFWKTLFKDPAYNTVEEYNRLESYGVGDSIFIPEGDLPEEDDSQYSRQYTKIKFMGVVRRVTHVMSVIKAAHGDAVARETMNGTLHLLKQIERNLFVGDENLVAIQFDGIETLIAKAFGSSLGTDGQYLGYEDDLNVIDMRGEPLSEDAVVDLTEQLVAEPNYGSPNELWAGTGVIKDLSKVMFPKERVNLPYNAGKAGLAITDVVTPFGEIGLRPDIFIPQSVVPENSGVGTGRSSKRPGVPVLTAPTSPAHSGTGTFFTADDAGAYIYKIVAGSRYGRSAPATSAAVTVSAADQVNIVVADVGPDTSYYEVYRSTLGGAAATCKSIFKVPRTAVVQTIVDLNRFMPGTSKAYLLSSSPQVYKWKQLAPFTKMPLAQIDTSIRWMQILYGALQLMKPRYNGMFINVGRLPTGIHAL